MASNRSNAELKAVRQAVEAAAVLHRAGKFPEAAAGYRQVLIREPNHPDALHLLGVIESQFGHRQAALELITRAIALYPRAADYHDNLGLVLSAMGRFDEAVVAHRKAVELNPRHHQASFNLGNVLHQTGQYDAAIAAYRAAASLRPDWPEANQNLASSLLARGLYPEAEAAARRALAQRPDFPEAHNTLGAVLGVSRRLDEATVHLRTALQLKPDMPAALANLGSALNTSGKFGEAIHTLRRAIELDPNLFEAYNNLGIALKDVGQLEESILVLQRAMALRPNAMDAITNLGNTLKDAGRLEDAIACWGRALALHPTAAHVHSNLVYTLQFHPAYEDETLLLEQRRWNRLHAESLKPLFRPHTNDRSRDRRLRVGYVSPYFYAQAETFFVIPLLEAHDRRNYEIHCYSDTACPDKYTQRARSAVDVWHDSVGKSHEEVAEQIRRDGIDVLVDLAMHMAHNRLPSFARKPAPVQVAWLAYPGGTGLDAMDYRITDSFMDPPDRPTPYYREESVRLPNCWCCYDPLTDVPSAAVRPDGPIRFGSINNPCKLNAPLLRLWSRVLQAVPDSRLLLQAMGQGHRDMLRRFFQEMKIKPDRLDFAGRTGRLNYLRLYDRIDIGLDPLPYNGITTTCDALWMGVPVVSLVGRTAAGRAGLSLLSNCGLADLVAHDADEFVRIARQLAADAPRLAEMRATLRDRIRHSPLMDARRFAGNMEAAYRRMWQRWCDDPKVRY